MNNQKKISLGIIIIIIIIILIIIGFVLLFFRQYGSKVENNSNIDQVNTKLIDFDENHNNNDLTLSQENNINDDSTLEEIFNNDTIFSDSKFEIINNNDNTINIKQLNNKLLIYVKSSEPLLESVEVRLTFNSNQTNIVKISESPASSGVGSSSYINEENWAIVHSFINPDLYSKDKEILIAMIDYSGENTFSVVKNRTFGVIDQKIIEFNTL